MECGYCKKPMQGGYIPTSALFWFPKKSSKSIQLFFKGPKTEGFRIGQFYNYSLKKQRSWYCPECDLILIDAKGEEEISF